MGQRKLKPFEVAEQVLRLLEDLRRFRDDECMNFFDDVICSLEVIEEVSNFGELADSDEFCKFEGTFTEDDAAAIDGGLSDAESQLEDAKSEIENVLANVKEGLKTLAYNRREILTNFIDNAVEDEDDAETIREILERNPNLRTKIKNNSL